MVSIGESIPVKNCDHEKADTRIVVHTLHGSACTTCVMSTQLMQLSLMAHSMIWLRLNIWPTSEWYLAWAIIAGFTTSMPFVKAWGATIKSITCAPRIFRLQHTIPAFTSKVYLAGHPFQVLDADDDNPIINLKDTFFEPAVGSRPHFNRM